MITGVALVCLLGLGDIVMGQQAWNPVHTICNLNSGRSSIVGNRMYIDGGQIVDQMYFKNGTDQPYDYSDLVSWSNEHLWELDLSSKFNVSRPSWTAHPKPEDWNQHYNGVSGTLWDIGDGKFYTLGGWMRLDYKGPPPGMQIGEPYKTRGSLGIYFHYPDTRVFAYDPKTGNWSSELHHNLTRLSDTAYAQSTRNKVGYIFGGNEVNEVDFLSTNDTPYSVITSTVSTMSTYDFRTGKFNVTENPSEIGAIQGLQMHCLERVGNEGVLVAFSGTNVNFLRGMDEILIYDIETSTWTKEYATGDIPPPRMTTCSVLVPAPDLSSYQVYVFSGVSNTFILDMYVLSIPAFSWIKVEMKNYIDQYGIIGMARMTCALYEERQLIIAPGDVNVTLPGTNQSTDDILWTKCNNGTKVHVFDTYDWEFKPEFDPDKKGSKVPPLIVELVGGNSTGGATLNRPKAGWFNSALDSIFSTRNKLLPDVNITFPHNLPSESHNPPSGSQSTEESNNNGSILGGIISGIVGCAALVLCVSILWKKWKKSSQVEPIAELQVENPKELPTSYNTLYELHAYEPPEMSGQT